MSDVTGVLAGAAGLADVTCHPDIEYAEVIGFRPLELDLYLPPAAHAGRGTRPHTSAAEGSRFLCRWSCTCTGADGAGDRAATRCPR